MTMAEAAIVALIVGATALPGLIFYLYIRWS